MVHISTHLSKIVLKNKAALNAFANLFWRLAVAKLNSSPCFLLRYVLPTSAPLALSSLIRNSKTVKDLQDFIIVNAFVNKTGVLFCYYRAASDLLLRRDIQRRKFQTFIIEIPTPVTNHYVATFMFVCMT